MTPQEANKIIADFMGLEMSQFEHRENYVFKRNHAERYALFTDSLDALVPVWEKGGLTLIINLDFMPQKIDKWSVSVAFWAIRGEFSGKGKTIQEAAAIATAKAILELDKE